MDLKPSSATSLPPSSHPLRLRFAPSPTGYLHVGGARTALYNYLLARQSPQGVFVLRLEDTDQARSTHQSAEQVMEDLLWLGLQWDEGPYRQSDRLEIYKTVAESLIAQGRAYYCFLTDQEIEDQRQQALLEKRQPHVQSPYADLSPQEAFRRAGLDWEAWVRGSGGGGRRNGETRASQSILTSHSASAPPSPVVRFKTKDLRKDYILPDLVRGEVRFPSDMVGDFVLLRSGGMPVYNFCCAVDDHEMEITHVLRAEEHLSNTLRQLMIYEAMGWAPPRFGHISLILDEDRKKLSKRKGATSCHEFRQEGYLPEALKNFLALLGWTHPQEKEILTESELIENFSIERVHPQPAVFDPVKLKWINANHLRALSDDDLWSRILPFLESGGLNLPEVESKDSQWRHQCLTAFRPKMETLVDAVELFRPLCDGEFKIHQEGVECLKWESTPQVLKTWIHILTHKITNSHLSEDDFLQAQDEVQKLSQVKGKFLFMPLRVAVIGRPHGAELKTLVPLIHRKNLIERAQRVLSSSDQGEPGNSASSAQTSNPLVQPIPEIFSQPLRVYNSLTHQKEEFEPLHPGEVKMYVCGPTVYDYLHVGNFRGPIFYNLLSNWLEAKGYKVTYVYNYTDIDDKIIQRAQEKGLDVQALADHYIGEFQQDLATLKLRPQDQNPRVTQTMGSIQSLIQKLIDRGSAYEAENHGGVYFSVETFKNYGHLSGRRLDSTEEIQDPSSRDEKKRNPLDFALWKPSKKGEPFWDSPWGPGRPGWHIECSAMVTQYLGEEIDIHGGGLDLLFPHHENEIAQSESAHNGKKMVRYWIHHNMLVLEGSKMSKSLGNIRTARSFMNEYTPEVLKYLMLSAHYRSELNFGEASIEKAIREVGKFYSALALAESLVGPYSPESSPSNIKSVLTMSPPLASEDSASISCLKIFKDCSQALDDDFNTPELFAILFGSLRQFNGKFRRGQKLTEIQKKEIRDLQILLLGVGRWVSLFQQPPSVFLNTLDDLLLGRLGLTRKKVDDLVQERWRIRQTKDFSRSDELRDQLNLQGISVSDLPEGSFWEVTKKE